jgi:hypothetical protein
MAVISFEYVLGQYLENIPVSAFLDETGTVRSNADIATNVKKFLAQHHAGVMAQARREVGTRERLPTDELTLSERAGKAADKIEKADLEEIVDYYLKRENLTLDKYEHYVVDPHGNRLDNHGNRIIDPNVNIHNMTDAQYKAVCIGRYFDKIKNYQNAPENAPDPKIDEFLQKIAKKLAEIHKEELKPLYQKITKAKPLEEKKLTAISLSDALDISNI